MAEDLIHASEPAESGATGSDNTSESYYDYKKNRRNQRIAMSILGVVGAGIMILGFMQLRSSIQVPWPTSKNKKAADELGLANTKIEKSLSDLDAATLKKQDTDEDGINDFEELYVYGTSAYLADSDSDGKNDLDEINVDEDPTCPTGTTCFSKSDETAGLGLASPTTDDSGAASSPSSSEIANLSAAQLREIILQSGKVTKEQLNQIDDKTILDFYQQMLKENPDLAKSAALGSSPEATAPTTKAEAVDQVKNVSAAEIKKMLINQGIDESEFDGVDDETLKKLYLEAVDNAAGDSLSP